VNLTLVDFGASGKKGTSRGDVALSLLLFESDSYDTVSRGDNLLPEKLYKGGSRGAFEAMAKLREGSVIALLNPRVLKPLQVTSSIFVFVAATKSRGPFPRLR
jgi:minichromosome maintenance protein 10